MTETTEKTTEKHSRAELVGAIAVFAIVALVAVFGGSALHSHFYAKNLICSAEGQSSTFHCGADNAVWQIGQVIHVLGIGALVVIGLGGAVVLVMRDRV
jgi:hypothetical protein